MTREEEIRAMAEAATPSPWGFKKDVGDRFYVHAPSYGIRDFCCLSGGFERREDAEFIAHARTDIPYLLDENARLRTELDAAQTKLSSVHESLDYADRLRNEAKNMAELAVSNGLALGRIAVALGHEYGPCAENGGHDDG